MSKNTKTKNAPAVGDAIVVDEATGDWVVYEQPVMPELVGFVDSILEVSSTESKCLLVGNNYSRKGIVKHRKSKGLA